MKQHQIHWFVYFQTKYLLIGSLVCQHVLQLFLIIIAHYLLFIDYTIQSTDKQPT